MSEALCRDCGARVPAPAGRQRCPRCASPRLLSHPELSSLALAHVDCDAFYAAVEKRDHPEIAHRPVIVGGGRRGVVSAACYVARTFGVHSAMPMFKALKACPDAVVLRPNMEKYAAVGREVRALMLELTPLVEPLALDEAFLDLSGTERLHRRGPAEILARLARDVEDQVGITVSIGLSYNKFLAKVASDLDKPRGFAVIGRAEARAFLASQPVSLIWGVGAALRKRLEADGFDTIAQLARTAEDDLVARYGAIGRRLARFARGQDERRVDPNAPAKSISAETTFDRDIRELDELEAILWRLSEKVAARLKRRDLAGRSLTLKLKTAGFRLRTRSRRLEHPSQLAEVFYQGARTLLAAEADGTAFRLIGVGVGTLVSGAEADPPDLLDPGATRRAEVERAIDAVRARHGARAIGKGRGVRRKAAAAASSLIRRAPRGGSTSR
ncbi:MAG: DNA polymerase IV [Alphaproteobacteria bacterium]|nr:DNA polymerase IV [Alphaproteobacteria bacterium]